MKSYAFELPNVPVVKVQHSELLFPLRRVYCVGRNYVEHTREMGADPEHEPPFFFTKPADAVVTNNDSVPYPARTQDLQHEVELVVALGATAFNISPAQAADCIFGYAVGNDLTRRDLQSTAKAMRRPWDTAKGFDCSAPVSAIVRKEEVGELKKGNIWLKVNGEVRQQGDLGQMIWSVKEVISELSNLYMLHPGDLILTGTPSGVGTVLPGDVMEGYIEKVGNLVTRIQAS